MIAGNIYRATGEFCTNVLFKPYDILRAVDGWWASNVVSFTFISIGAILFLYWLIQLQKFQRAGTE